MIDAFNAKLAGLFTLHSWHIRPELRTFVLWFTCLLSNSRWPVSSESRPQRLAVHIGPARLAPPGVAHRSTDQHMVHNRHPTRQNEWWAPEPSYRRSLGYTIADMTKATAEHAGRDEEPLGLLWVDAAEVRVVCPYKTGCSNGSPADLLTNTCHVTLTINMSSSNHDDRRLLARLQNQHGHRTRIFPPPSSPDEVCKMCATPCWERKCTPHMTQ